VGIFGKPSSEPKLENPTPKPAPAAPAPAQAQPTAAAGRVSVIAPKAVFKGEVSGDEDIVVEGTVEGQVRLSRELRVAQGGVVRATVVARSIVVSGEVVGNCVATARIEIQSTGRLTGDIKAPRINIAEGGVFKGKSEMSPRGDARQEKTVASS
jgi:cytoskeletal protein CcmA (bactofilin family)